MTLCIHFEVVVFLAESSHGHLVLQKTVQYVDEVAADPSALSPVDRGELFWTLLASSPPS